MFSPNAFENTKLIDSAFIGGVNGENIQRYIVNSDANLLVPECLVKFSNTEAEISSEILEYVFPTGISIRYSEETPKFFSVTLTNEKGFRSYIYILILWQKIEFNDSSFLQNCINKIDIGADFTQLENTPIKNNQTTLNKTKETNYFFLPLAVCLSSSLFHTENFKEILHEFVKIVKYQNKSISSHLDYSDDLEKYRYLEILNYFNFLGNTIIPPNFSTLRLNLRFSQVDFYLPSNYEIPTDGKNSCIQILFECLEISIIIKLWCSILTEKHIIIMANQNFLLFSICEALMRLIFPLKWLHTYVPLLPASQIEFLESPTPYIMGILSNSISYESLIETLPEHVICNVDTSEIHAENVVKLPQTEETKLRKKLQFVKNPDIFDIEEIITGQNKIMIEDVLPDRSFSDNVQHIFFRIFRNALGGFKTKYMLDSVFYQEDFLNDLATLSEQHKMFWDKIIKTSAFEYFILSSQYLEVSNTKIFKNVIRLKEEDMQEKLCFNMAITLPDDNIEKLFKEINSVCLDPQVNYEKEIIIYNNFIKDHAAANEQQEFGNYVKTEEFDESAENFTLVKRKATARSHTVKWNNINSFYQSINNTYENISSLNDQTYRKNSNRIDMTCYNLHSGNLLSCKFLTNIIKCEKESEEFSFYKSQTSKKIGFIQYINNILNNLKLSNCGRNFLDFGMKSELKKILEEKITKKSTLSANLHCIDEMNYELEENEINLENRRGISSSNNVNSMASTAAAADKFSKSNKPLKQDTINSIKSKWVDLAKINKKEILELEWSECFQYHLAMAYLFEEFLLEDKKLIEKDNLFKIILQHYEKAFMLSKKEFPSVRFYKLIDKLDTEFLFSLRNDFYEKYHERREKRFFTVSHLQEKEIKIHKGKSDLITNKSLKDNKTLRLIKIINVKYEKIKKRKKKIGKSLFDNVLNKTEKIKKNNDIYIVEITRNSPKMSKENGDSSTNLFSNSDATKDHTKRASALTPISLKLKENIKSGINSKFSNTVVRKSPPNNHSHNSKCDKDQESFSSFLSSMKNAIREDMKKIQAKKKEISNSNKDRGKESVTSPDIKLTQALTVSHKSLKVEIPANICALINSNPNSGSNYESMSNTCSHSNFLKNIKNYFFGNCDANRIIDTMKKCDGHIKTVVINSYIKYSKSVKDPIALVEEISQRLISLFEDFSLNKFNSDVLNTKVIHKVTSSENFNNLKENVAELQKINIAKFSSNTEKICFWLNLFNFLTIFTILHNVEILSTQYEWIRFLKNSLFNIGGYDLTLFEIQNCILSENCNFYGNCEDYQGFNPNDIRTKLVIEEKSVFISFAVAIPTKTSSIIRFYNADNLEENLRNNLSQYCQTNISVDHEKGIVNMSEFITWIDRKFISNIDNYIELIDKTVYESIRDNNLTQVKNKFSWKTDFTNVITKLN